MLAFLLAIACAPDAPELPAADSQSVVVAAKKHVGGNAESVAISTDGNYVAAGFGGPSNGRFPLKANGGGVFVWERKTGKQTFAQGQYGDVIKVGFSRDGRYLAYTWIYTPGDSIDLHQTVLIDLGTKSVAKKWRSESFAFSPSDDLIAVSASRGIDVIGLETLERQRTLAARSARALTFSADGKTLAAVCYYWENNRGTPTGLAVFDPTRTEPRVLVNDGSLRAASALAVSPDGASVVTGHVGGVAKIWNANTSDKPRTLSVETELALFPLFVRAGKTLVLATQPANGVSWTYDASTPSGFRFKKGKTPPWSELHLVDFRSGKERETWRLEDASFRTIYARFGSSRRYPEYNPARFALSADGKTLIAGCNGCSAIDAATGKLLRTFARSSEADKNE
jgi:WD40 repeat protein